MKKQKYMTPEIEWIEVNVEQGFTLSEEISVEELPDYEEIV